MSVIRRPLANEGLPRWMKHDGVKLRVKVGKRRIKKGLRMNLRPTRRERPGEKADRRRMKKALRMNLRRRRRGRPGEKGEKPVMPVRISTRRKIETRRLAQTVFSTRLKPNDRVLKVRNLNAHGGARAYPFT